MFVRSNFTQLGFSSIFVDVPFMYVYYYIPRGDGETYVRLSLSENLVVLKKRSVRERGDIRLPMSEY